jgi:hypothetical protein
MPSLLLVWILDIFKKVDDNLVHLTEVESVMFDTPGLGIRQCKGKLKEVRQCEVSIRRLRYTPEQLHKQWHAV